jgi:hypothetical protein
MDLEKDLRAAFARRDPPPGFAGRVLQRVAAEQERRRAGWRQWFAPATMRWAMAGGLAVAVMGAGLAEYRQRQGEMAKERVVLALQIAGSKLNYAQRKVQQVRLPAAALGIDRNEETR